MENLLKEDFIAAWNKFPPSKLEKFFYKYFSKESEINILWILLGIIFIPFLIGFIGTIANWNRSIIGISTIIFSLELVIIAIPWIYVWYYHNRRIKKIIKELGCTLYEYENAVNKWGKYLK